MHIHPTAPASARELALALSDLESGTPRQWYWLEIAAALPPSSSQSLRTRAAIWLLRRGGVVLVWPWLRAQTLPGLALYERCISPLWRKLAQIVTDSALVSAALPALLAGFDRLPASQIFVAWLLLFGGMIWHSWRELASTATIVAEVQTLPGPEDSVGLTGQLLAAGTPPADALALTAAVRTNVDTALATLLLKLPNLAPAPPNTWYRSMLAGAAWLVASLPMALTLSILPTPFGLPFGVVACAAITARCKSYLVGSLVLLAGLVAFALGRLGHAI